MPFTLQGAGASALGLIATQGAAFLVEAAVARRLGASSLGVLAIGTGLTTAFGATIVSGCASAASAHVARRHETGATGGTHLRLALQLALLASGVVAVILAALADPLASLLGGGDPAARVIRLFSAALPFQSVGGVGVAVALALRRPQVEIAYRWTDALVRAASIPALYLFGANIEFIAAIHLAAAVVSAPIGLIPAVRLAGPSDEPLRVYLREFVSLAGWQTLATSAWLAVRRTDVLIVSAILGTAAAGAYRLAVLLASLSGTVMLALQPVFFPVAARRLASGGQAGLADHYRRVTRFAILTTAPISAVLIATNGVLVRFFGLPFEGAGTPLVILAVAQSVLAAGGHSTTVLQIAGAPARAAANLVMSSALQTMALVAGSIALGVPGAAFATLAGAALMHTVQVRSIAAYARIDLIDGSWLRATGLAALILILGGIGSTLVAIPALAAAFGAVALTLYAVLALRALPENERRILRQFAGGSAP
jgi:O-antigen/teichoic acid export membrane protein